MANNMSMLDANQVTKSVYDEPNTALRVNVVASTGGGASSVTVTNAAGAAAVNIQDGGNSITVDGTVAATQSGTWTVQPGNTANTTAWKVDGSAVTQPVSGTFFQATQPVSAATLPLPTGASTEAKQDVGNSSLSSIDGKVPANLTVTATRLLVDGSGVTQPVSGTFFQATQPVSSTLDSSSTSAVTSVASSATSVSLLASTPGRKAAYFFNDSMEVLYLKLGSTASTSSYTLQIQPNGFYEMPSKPVYTGAIDGIWFAADGNVRITELT